MMLLVRNLVSTSFYYKGHWTIWNLTSVVARLVALLCMLKDADADVEGGEKMEIDELDE